jgi:hypothetical protein
MLVIYMPIVRDAAQLYADIWNMHRMRKQPNRPNAVIGQPQLLYHYPPHGVRMYKLPVDAQYILDLQSSLREWGKYASR